MVNLIEKSKVLIEALPYIEYFSGKTFVIKYGGSAMKNPNIENLIIQDIALLKLVGIKLIIIHGGGSEIDRMLNKLSIKTEFIDGLRITDEKTMEVAEMVLAGKINKKIVNKLQAQKINSVGITGKDGQTFITKKKLNNKRDIGYVGDIVNTNTRLINTLIQNDFIPVIAPIGTDLSGNTYNINADFAASSVAVALKAEKLVYLTDIEGVLKNIQDKNSIISEITASECNELIKSGIISKGMIPKVQNCINAINKGVNRVHIIDGRIEHSLLFEIFTNSGIGTMFVK